VTEVPEHLLARSKARRAALGGGDAGAPTPPSGGDAGDSAAPAAAVARAEAAAPVVAEPAAPPPPPPPYVQAALDRKKVPWWMASAGVLTLLWAFVYAGVLFTSEEAITDPVLAEGQELYAAQCAGCHGGAGQGGTGRPLAGEVLLTFPNRADHIAWVVNGSPAAGTPYGDPNRPGGQHISQDNWGAMPAFGETLSEEEILAVVRYEREVLDEEETTAGDAEAPANEAQAEGGQVQQSSSSGEEGGSSGSGETEGAEEDSTDVADESGGDGGPENP